MDKDNRYWNAHKKVFNTLFNELDKDIANRIYRNPSGIEARLLNRRVEKEVKQILQEEPVV